MMIRSKKSACIMGALIGLAALALDQITKLLAIRYLMDKNGPELIPHVLSLKYLENRGMAFGLLSGRRWLLVVMCLLILLGVVVIIYKMQDHPSGYPIIVILFCLMAGGAGNFIDRIFRGYVVDFIYFELIDFPIFNIADCFVVVNGILLVIMILFMKEE